MGNSKGTILLIAPVFFDYYKSISDELEKNGYHVLIYSDRPKETFFYKALLRLNRNITKKRNKKYLQTILKDIRDIKIDRTIVILGQCFDGDDFLLLKESHKESVFVFYNWDSTKNFPQTKYAPEIFDYAYSFDKDDVKDNGFKFLPLFYSNENIKTEIKYDYSAVMTIKKGKYKRFNEIVQSIDKKDINSFTHLYLQSRLVYLYYKLFNKEFKSSHMNEFSYKPISKRKFYEVMEESKIVIDCQMDNQTGLTMRTFEALHARKKVITTNSSIKEYDFYSPNNIFVVDGNSKIPNSFFENEFDSRFSLSEKYSLSSFVKTLLHDD